MQGPCDKLPFSLKDGSDFQQHQIPATYQITHVETGDVYIGSTGNLHTRLRHHTTTLKAGKHSNRNLQARFNEDPELRIDYCPAQNRGQAIDLEQEILDDFRMQDHVLNCSTDATSPSFGVVRSEENNRRNSERAKAQFADPAVRKVWSDRMKTQMADPDYRAHRLALMNAAKPDVMSDETRKKISDAQCRPVVYEGVEYPSAKAAREALGIPKTTMQRLLKAAGQTRSRS